MNLVAVIVIIAVVLLAVIIWLFYNVSAAYQQTITVNMDFNNTYRYVPNLSIHNKYKLDSISVTVSGAIKRDTAAVGTIIPANTLKALIYDNIITPYEDCLILQEAHTFMVDENVLKRHPIVKNATIENLSIIFFNKLSSLTAEVGGQLLDVTLVSDGLTSSHSRFKPNNYSL